MKTFKEFNSQLKEEDYVEGKINANLIKPLDLRKIAKTIVSWNLKVKKRNVEAAIKILTDLGYPVTTKKSSPGGKTLALYSPSYNSFYINPTHGFWKDPVRFSKEYFAKNELSSDNPLHTIVHELGHSRFDAEENWFGGRYGPELKIAETLSKYATKNPIEFVAEFVAAYNWGRKMTNEQILLFNQYAKPRK